MCGGEFGGPAGARKCIVHYTYPGGCGSYYGHQWTKRDREERLGITNMGDGLTCDPIWLWYITARERDYLRSIGQPIDQEFPWKPKEVF